MKKKVVFLLKISENSNNYTPAIHQWYGVLEYLGYEVHYFEYASYEAEDFYTKMKSLKPDYIFHPTYENFHSEFVRLREFSKVYLIHSDDDWRFDNYIKYWIPFTDGAIGYQNSEDAYLKCGAPKGYYNRARWAFNPNMMMYYFDSLKKYNLSHVGNLHGDKKVSVDTLTKMGLKIDLIPPKYSSFSEYLESYHNSIMSLCFTSNSVRTGAQSKTRITEMPYYCILVSEAWPNMEKWNMEPGVDFILVDTSKDEFLYQIERCIQDSSFANKMYESGKRVLLNKNTCFHEWDSIMKNIDPDYGGIDVSILLKKLEVL